MNEKQRALLKRAIEEGGKTLLWNRSDTLIAKHLDQMGLGKAFVHFEINDAGRAEAEHVAKIGERVIVTLPLASGGTMEREGQIEGHTASGLLKLVVSREYGPPVQMTVHPREVRPKT